MHKIELTSNELRTIILALANHATSLIRLATKYGEAAEKAAEKTTKIKDNLLTEYNRNFSLDDPLEAIQADTLSDSEYKALLQLYHEYNTAFLTLSENVKSLFYKRLYQDK